MPPIVISRSNGEIQAAPQLSPEQKDKLWESIIRAYVSKHPEIFDEEEPTQ